MNDRDALIGAVTLAALGGALFTGRSEPVWVILGAGLVGVGAEASTKRSVRASLAGVVAAGLGGWIVADLATRNAPTPAWMKVLTVLVAIAVALSAGALDAVELPAVFAHVAVIATAGGIWACVPETDGPGRGLAVVAIAAAAGIVLRRPVAPAVFGAVLGLMLFAGLQGGQYRASAVVGMAGSFGLFLLVGAVASAVPGRLRLGQGAIALVVAHTVAVGVSSRGAGRGDRLVRSVLIEAVVLAGLVVAIAVVARSNKERAS